uniref:Defensin-like protein n=1 Tax=Strongyloides venezuelensis TaxID=75913 RepID=A0A0K0F2V1_STRVS
MVITSYQSRFALPRHIVLHGLCYKYYSNCVARCQGEAYMPVGYCRGSYPDHGCCVCFERNKYLRLYEFDRYC